MRLITALFILFLTVSPLSAKTNFVYQYDNGRLNTYIVDQDPGETRVFNLNTGQLGVSQRDPGGDRWNSKYGPSRPDPVMDSLMNEGGDGDE